MESCGTCEICDQESYTPLAQLSQDEVMDPAIKFTPKWHAQGQDWNKARGKKLCRSCRTEFRR